MLPLWFSLLGCDAMFAPVRISPPGTIPDTAAPVDTASTGQDTGDTTVVRDTTYTLRPITDGLLPASTKLGPGGFVSGSNDFTYFLESDGTALHYLTPSYTAPEGDYCVNGAETTDGDCRGTLWYSGRVIIKDVGGMCLDEDNGRLFLVKDGNGRIEVVDLSAGGRNAYSYNRAASFLQIPEDVGNPLSFNSSCVYDAPSNSLLVLSPEAKSLARLSLSSTDVNSQSIESGEIVGPMSPHASQILAMDDGTFLAGGAAPSQLLHIDGSANVLAEIPLDAEIVDVDVHQQQAIVSLGSLGAVHVDLAQPASSPTPLPISGSTGAVAYDPSTGTALVAHVEGGVHTLTLVHGATVMDAVVLDPGVEVLDIATPTGNGDFVVATQTGEDIGYRVFDAWPDTPPDLPPLDVFIFSAIEEPFDSAYFSMDCEEDIGSTPSMETRIARIEANAAVLAGLGVPVALGLTHNFVSKLSECGRLDVLDTFEAHGFEVGVMVHNRPDYSCTDVSLDGTDYEGQRADYCEISSGDYCNPNTSDSCVFDGTPDPFFPDVPGASEYCPPGQWDCYLSYMDRYNAVVDSQLYDGEGGRFIVGADRHGMWGFDWTRVYKDISRPDGSQGFPTTFLAQGRAYSGELALNDPREKNPVPWRPDARTEVWALGDDYQAWDKDSAFSDTVMFNGMPISTIKIYEWQLSGLHMGDYLLNKNDVGNGTQAYSEEDFAVVYQFLRNAINNRSPYGSNAWYFHIHDLSLTLNLAEDDGTPFDQATWLAELIDQIQQDFGDESAHPGQYIRWSTPSEIDAYFLETRR